MVSVLSLPGAVYPPTWMIRPGHIALT